MISKIEYKGELRTEAVHLRSGKTIISFITALNVIKSGYQCALMAPTEILAKQHFQSFKKLFSPY